MGMKTHNYKEGHQNEKNSCHRFCGYHPAAAEIVHRLKEKGLRVALATNPIFPARATQWPADDWFH